ncbi:hypothetical protein R1sor_004414 [Riccia sorocarpa]|uniref:Uncharacterized protein n=1 Tax=Riccia sorocarpa TaxID=122646 RepID=A0ABD3HH98_9MARC
MSVYAPNKRSGRMRFWNSMKDMLGDDPWVLIGDFNIVEVADDARGKSALIIGSEARLWRSMSVEKGLVDSFFCTARHSGSRWARCWSRVKTVLKQARKDRAKKKQEDSALAEELARRRANLTSDLSEAEIELLATLERRAREQELHEAKIWRIRSREKWLSVDEAPTRRPGKRWSASYRNVCPTNKAAKSREFPKERR